MSDHAPGLPSLGRAGTAGAPVEPAGPAGPWPRWMIDLEQAHDRLRRAVRLIENAADPVTDTRPVARALERAFGAMYDVFDQRDDGMAATRRALEALDEAIRHLPTAAQDPVLQHAAGELALVKKHVADVETRLASLVLPPKRSVPDLRASVDVPRLHQLDRPSIVPMIRVPAPPSMPLLPPSPPDLPTAKTFEQLDLAVEELKRRAEARRRPKLDKATMPGPKPNAAPMAGTATRLPAVDELAFVRSCTRDCFEEIAMVGTQRAPLLGDPWRSALVLERRMLAAIDAIVALGPSALGYLEPLVLDSPARDASRAFAIGMALGCVTGRDALGAVERVVLALEPAEPAALGQLGAALKLVPHDLLPLALRTFLTDPDPAHRALAIDVLAYRGIATTEELVTAARDAPKVAAAALPYLGLIRHAVATDAIDAGLGHEDRAVREAAWLAAALSGRPVAASVLASELLGERAEAAASLLALIGDGADAARLLELATAHPSRALVSAVGWAGAASAVRPLVHLLEHDDEIIALEAAYALERITGAGLWEEVEVPAEEIMVAEPPEPALGEPSTLRLAQLVSDPRDLPGQPAPDLVQRPTVRADRWKAYWAERGPSYEPRARYRRGQPYTPLVSLRELDGGLCTPSERRTLVRELVVRTGGHVPLDPHDWVVVQEAALRAWEPLASRASGSPGTWSRSSPARA